MGTPTKLTVSRWTTDEADHTSEVWVNMGDLCLGEHTDCVCVGVPAWEDGRIKPNHFGIVHLTREQATELAEKLLTVWR